MQLPHSFNIPVMGTGYTIDTPVKTAHYGINSVISIIDDDLIEQVREYHCKQNEINFYPVNKDDHDSRAKRITAYLNLVQQLVESNTEELRNSEFDAGTEITKYFEMLPDTSVLKQEYLNMLLAGEEMKFDLQTILRKKIVPGEIQVNIMTKIDKTNYNRERNPLPREFNDAHAALRGFANSSLSSSLVLSAGMNPALYGYMATFDAFLPDKNGQITKKIILKVSDYRSALIQGKFLAKKGLWVSEFRIESGLNCGGHSFASAGYLLGPVLEEFKMNKQSLIQTLYALYTDALKKDNREVPAIPVMNITVQGGIGTSEEHNFLIDYYGVDAVGWGSPFMLVPEAVNIDNQTLGLISRGKEEDFYLSDISPLGVPFNTIRGNSAEQEKQSRIEKDRPGAPCIKKYLLFNTEFSDKPVCTASREYQKQKIEELKLKNPGPEEYTNQLKKITEKECLCIGLGNSFSMSTGFETYSRRNGVTVCPGPNMAYFSKIVSLKKMVDHIYGKINIISRNDRPNMFLKELELYIDYLKKKVTGAMERNDDTQLKYFRTFQQNLESGINYYKELFASAGKSSALLQGLILLQERFYNIFIEQDVVSV
ncbi:MAG TPA: hypothetical protein VE912_25300 [Bacteroidales bacterium]|nr:hypothetical protein [Bacteroidales bacterium]